MDTPVKSLSVQKLGEHLVNLGHITADHLRIALHEQKNKKDLLGSILVNLNFLSDEALAQSLAQRTGLPLVEGKDITILPRFLGLWPKKKAQSHAIVPFAETPEEIYVALTDPYDLAALDAFRQETDCRKRIGMFIASTSEMNQALDRIYGLKTNVNVVINAIESISQNVEAQANPAIITLVDTLLSDALRLGASDIHLEPDENLTRVRYRIDGVLEQAHEIHSSHWAPLSQRIKLLAKMDISDRRSVQDGRFSQNIDGRNLDFRISIMPTLYGENIVIRLLDRQKNLLTLPQLGYSPYSVEMLAQILEKPEGLILVTGPTGAGKTTTLYALMNHLNSADVNIATLEEPIEYQLKMIRQTAISESSKIDFATGVRAVLRQDPDIIMVGEIRDEDTARMALRAAMTGHRVLATLHCNDVDGAIPRLVDLGLSPRSLAGNISGIVAQRLVRTLCPQCKISCPISDEEALLLKVSVGDLAVPIGCEYCRNTGRVGRTALSETVRINKRMNDALCNGNTFALRDYVDQNKHQTLQSDGIARVLRKEIALGDLRRTIDMRMN